jgi:2OG-Fe(II) oxygenase superfamily
MPDSLGVHSFTPTPTTTTTARGSWRRRRGVWKKSTENDGYILSSFRRLRCLFAAAKKAKGEGAVSSKGGFGNKNSGFKEARKAVGTVVKTDAVENDDYRIFPPLNSQIQETLVPASQNNQENLGELSDEIYSRLKQIYGFPNFNYESPPLRDDESTTPPSSVMDLLRVPTGDDETNGQANEHPESLFPMLDLLPAFDQFHVLHVDPLVLSIDNFFTAQECDAYVAKSTTSKGESSIVSNRSPTVGKDVVARSQRTSTTWYHAYSNVPELLSKACRLLGIDAIDRFEEVQTVRYRAGERFTWHIDALGPASGPHDKALTDSGQRVATLLVYLTEMCNPAADGGATIFRDLYTAGTRQRVQMQPKKGSALLFFPSAGGIQGENDVSPLDIRTLHCGEKISMDATAEKWIAQLWLRQRPYTATAPPQNNPYEVQVKENMADYCRLSSS